MWVLQQSNRLKEEIAAIETLEAENEWLSSVRRRLLSNVRLAIDFIVSINGEDLPFTLTYPDLFPETPPSITPSDGRQYSSHQWGSGGELCLEYRSDNWDPAVTGAMLITSAHRLLAGERPAPDQRAIVQSAHASSLGQKLRNAYCRFLLTPSFRGALDPLADNHAYACRVAETNGQHGSCTAYALSLSAANALVWSETDVPFRDAQVYEALVIRVPAIADVDIQTRADIEGLLSLTANAADPALNHVRSAHLTIVCDATNARAYFTFCHEGVRKFIPYRTIDLSADLSQRVPESYMALARKTVGIVGCGSLGSKIAASMARCGVRGFILVDDDIFTPGNLKRHELDAESIGAHKVEALAVRLRALAAGLLVTTHRIALGGQESSGSTAIALDKLATCDLLIDATADPQAFNFVASVSLRARRPMIWSEVYAGGIGGFIARVRPDLEPPPHVARRQYQEWCHNQGVPWDGVGDDYDVSRADTPPVVADDADVGVIAAHATRIAIDALLARDISAFPHPAYVIGLARDWLFEQPFDTRPIDFTPEGAWPQPITAQQGADAIEYLVSMLSGE
jgi:sulfur-carrier protein adenylyltransferase/sulfurtransferase